MSNEAAIRETIKETVEAITNVGVVHDYERWSSEWSAFLDLFRTTVGNSKVIRGWTITCESFPQSWENHDKNIRREYTYKLRGYFGLDDSAASEKEAMVIVEDVVEAFDDDLNQTGQWTNVNAADLTVFEPRVFGDVLCHYAEVTVGVREFK